MFLTEDDYTRLIQDEDLDVVQQSDEPVRQAAERTAIEQMSGYLRSRYDISDIFSKDGNNRNQLLVMFAMDITLYHLHASVPSRVMPEIRVKRYDDAIRWLEHVQVGKINPGLALISEDDPGAPIRFGSNEKMENSW